MKKNFLSMLKTLVWTLLVMIVVSTSDCCIPMHEESVAVCSESLERGPVDVND